MSFFIDISFLKQIAHRIPGFHATKKDTWNCRCIICGDSKKNKRKMRGYFYRMKNDLFYKCHNCAVSISFGTFLQKLDPSLHQQYVYERYAAGMNGPKAHKEPEFKFEQPIFTLPSVLDTVATRLDKLLDTNEAVQYCKERLIPPEKYKELYYISSVKDITKIAPGYDTIRTQEPRLLIPFYNDKGNLTGVTMRALRGESLRYIMVKLCDNEPLIFGMNTLDKTRPITVVEGAIDSLFLDNAIACNGASFGKIETLNLPSDQLTIVFDNQPRNKEVVKLVEKYVGLNYQVCIWPVGTFEKDVNDLFLRRGEVRQFIRTNTYQGLMAELQLSDWRKC